MSELREIGLTEYEEKIYLTLLKEGSLTGGQVSRLSNVPHGRTYEVLQHLARKGFVSILPIKPKLFKAVEPKIAVKEHIDQKISRLQNMATSMPAELQRLKETQIKPKEVDENITIVAGKENMLKIIKHQIETSEKYVKQMFTYEFEPYPVIQATQIAISRGIKFKNLATKLTKDGLERMKKDIERGVEVRYYPVQELRLSVKDGVSSIQTMLNPANPKDRITILIESEELTQALEHYFDILWKKAKKIGEIKQKDILMT